MIYLRMKRSFGFEIFLIVSESHKNHKNHLMTNLFFLIEIQYTYGYHIYPSKYSSCSDYPNEGFTEWWSSWKGKIRSEKIHSEKSENSTEKNTDSWDTYFFYRDLFSDCISSDKHEKCLWSKCNPRWSDEWKIGYKDEISDNIYESNWGIYDEHFFLFIRCDEDKCKKWWEEIKEKDARDNPEGITTKISIYIRMYVLTVRDQSYDIRTT